MGWGSLWSLGVPRLTSASGTATGESLKEHYLRSFLRELEVKHEPLSSTMDFFIPAARALTGAARLPRRAPSGWYKSHVGQKSELWSLWEVGRKALVLVRGAQAECND